MDKDDTYRSDPVAHLEAAQPVLLVVQHGLIRGERNDHACSFAAKDCGELADWVEALAAKNNRPYASATVGATEISNSSLPEVCIDKVDTSILNLHQVQYMYAMHVVPSKIDRRLRSVVSQTGRGDERGQTRSGVSSERSAPL